MKTKILALLKLSSSCHWQAVELSTFSCIRRPRLRLLDQLLNQILNSAIATNRSYTPGPIYFGIMSGNCSFLDLTAGWRPVLGVIECLACYFPLLVRWHCSPKCSLRKSLLAFLQPWNPWNMPHGCLKSSVPRLHGNTMYIKLRN